jgi:hypothetical protein
LKEKWTLEHEAICYFIHSLITLIKPDMRNFSVFKSLIRHIFMGLEPMAAVLQLQMTSYRYCRSYRLNQNYPFNDPSILNHISPDSIDLDRIAVCPPDALLKFNVKKRFLSDALLELSKYFDFFVPANACEMTGVLDSFSTFYEENDLFSTDRDRLPLESATQPRHLEAFTAFGTLMVVAFICARALPFIVSRVVIRHGFDAELIDDDFEDWPDGLPRSIQPIRNQLDAIRIGAMKLWLVRDRPLMRLPFFPRVFQMMPFSDFQDIIRANPDSGLYVVFRGMCVMIEVLRTEKVRIKLDRATLEDYGSLNLGTRGRRRRRIRTEPPLYPRRYSKLE